MQTPYWLLTRFCRKKANDHASCTAHTPTYIPDLIKALLLESSGDWDSAHQIAQNDSSSDGSWVHAYLHRVEGDLGNASYWYRSAGKKVSELSLDEEWEYIAMELLKKS